MKQGSIVKVAFVQADGKIKARPAILLKKTEPYGDWIVCGISSKIHLKIEGVDILIDEKHADFATWGLDFAGLIRLSFLVTIPEDDIVGILGNISDTTTKELLNNLINYLRK